MGSRDQIDWTSNPLLDDDLIEEGDAVGMSTTLKDFLEDAATFGVARAFQGGGGSDNQQGATIQDQAPVIPPGVLSAAMAASLRQSQQRAAQAQNALQNYQPPAISNAISDGSSDFSSRLATAKQRLQASTISGVDWGKIGREIGQAAAGSGLLIGKPILNAFGMGSVANAVETIQLQHGVLPDWAIAAGLHTTNPDYVVLSMHGHPTPAVGQGVLSVSIYGGSTIPGNGYKTGDGLASTFTSGVKAPIRVDVTLKNGTKKTLLNVDQALILGGKSSSGGNTATAVSQKAGGALAVAVPLAMTAAHTGTVPSTSALVSDAAKIANAAQAPTTAQAAAVSSPTAFQLPKVALSLPKTKAVSLSAAQQVASPGVSSTAADESALTNKLTLPTLTLPKNPAPSLNVSNATASQTMSTMAPSEDAEALNNLANSRALTDPTANMTSATNISDTDSATFLLANPTLAPTFADPLSSPMGNTLSLDSSSLSLDSSLSSDSSSSDDVSFDGGTMDEDELDELDYLADTEVLGDDGSNPFGDGSLPVIPASQAAAAPAATPSQPAGPPLSAAQLAAIAAANAKMIAAQQALAAFQNTPAVQPTNQYATSVSTNDFAQRLAAERQFLNPASYVSGNNKENVMGADLPQFDLDMDEVLGDLGDKLDFYHDGIDAEDNMTQVGLTDQQRTKLQKYLKKILKNATVAGDDDGYESIISGDGYTEIVGALTDKQRAKLKKYIQKLLSHATVAGGGTYDDEICDDVRVGMYDDGTGDEESDYVLGSHVLGAPLITTAQRALIPPPRAGFVPAVSVGGNPIIAHVTNAPSQNKPPLVPPKTTTVTAKVQTPAGVRSISMPVRKFAKPSRSLADRHMDSIKNAQDAGAHAVSIGKKLLAAAASTRVNVHGEVLGAISRAPKMTVAQIQAHARAAIAAGNNAIKAAKAHLVTLQNLPLLPNPYRSGSKGSALPMSVAGMDLDQEYDGFDIDVLGIESDMDAFDVLGTFASTTSTSSSSEDGYAPPAGTVDPTTGLPVSSASDFSSMIDPLSGVPFSQETDPNTGMPYTANSVDPSTGVPFSQESATGATSQYAQPPFYGVPGPPTASSPGVAMVDTVDYDASIDGSPAPGLASTDTFIYSSDPSVVGSSGIPRGAIQLDPVHQGLSQDINGASGATWWFGSQKAWLPSGKFGNGYIYEKGKWVARGSQDKKALAAAIASSSYPMAQYTQASLNSFKTKGTVQTCGPLIARPGMPVNNARCDVASGSGVNDVGTYSSSNNLAGAPSGSYAWFWYWDQAPSSAQAPVIAARLQQVKLDFQTNVATASANTATQIATDQLNATQAKQVAQQQSVETAATAYQYQQEQADAQNQAQLQSVADAQADQEQQSQDASAARMAQAQAQVQATQEQADAQAAAIQYSSQAQASIQAQQAVAQLASTDPDAAAALALQLGLNPDGSPVETQQSNDADDQDAASDYDRNQMSSNHDPMSDDTDDMMSVVDQDSMNNQDDADAMDSDELR